MDAVVIKKERGIISLRLWTGEVVRSPVGWIPVRFLKVGEELDVEIVRLPFVLKATRKAAEG